MSIKKIVITTISMLFGLSLFAQSQISGTNRSSAMTDRVDKTEFVETFYKEYAKIEKVIRLSDNYVVPNSNTN